MHIVTLLMVLLVLGAFWSVVLTRPRVRRVLGRHRVWVAVTVLPLQPLVLVLLVAVLANEPVTANGVVLCVLAYVNGLVAFALVTGIQDALRRERG
jgi:hypothetical protein